MDSRSSTLTAVQQIQGGSRKDSLDMLNEMANNKAEYSVEFPRVGIIVVSYNHPLFKSSCDIYALAKTKDNVFSWQLWEQNGVPDQLPKGMSEGTPEKVKSNEQLWKIPGIKEDLFRILNTLQVSSKDLSRSPLFEEYKAYLKNLDQQSLPTVRFRVPLASRLSQVECKISEDSSENVIPPSPAVRTTSGPKTPSSPIPIPKLNRSRTS